MTEYRVTFGQRYRRQIHHRLPVAHPDGWLAVEAEGEAQAREMVRGVIGTHWAFLYGPGELDEGFYPRGELARILPDGELVVPVCGEGGCGLPAGHFEVHGEPR